MKVDQDRITEMFLINAFDLMKVACPLDIASALLLAGYGLMAREIGAVRACEALEAIISGVRNRTLAVPSMPEAT